MQEPFAQPSSAALQRARATALAVVLGLTIAVTGLMGLVAAWMYWIVPSLMR
jgi:hypothetical protein